MRSMEKHPRQPADRPSPREFLLDGGQEELGPMNSCDSFASFDLDTRRQVSEMGTDRRACAMRGRCFALERNGGEWRTSVRKARSDKSVLQTHGFLCPLLRSTHWFEWKNASTTWPTKHRTKDTSPTPSTGKRTPKHATGPRSMPFLHSKIARMAKE